LKDGVAAATLNRELAAIKRMYRLGLRHGLVATMPYISLLTEHKVRKGFFELDQFREILRHLPAEYHALFEIAYITGWRIKSELLTRQWRHVDKAVPRLARTMNLTRAALQLLNTPVTNSTYFVDLNP
jgi:integrase